MTWRIAAARIFFPSAGMIDLPSMRTLEQTTQEVLDLAAKHFQLPTGSLAPGDDFFKKLAIDSLQTLEMLSRLEIISELNCPTTRFRRQRLQDSCRAIQSRL